MEITVLTQEIYKASRRLSVASEEIFKLAKIKSIAEREYRIALAKEMMILRADGHPVSLINDLARGSVADLKFNRDAASEKHRAALAAMESLRVEINALQTIARYQSDI